MTGIEKMYINSNTPLIPLTTDQKTVAADPAGRNSSGLGADQIELDTAHEKYIKQIDREENDSQKILEARKALESGQLDSIEAARLAAEAILHFGI